MADKIKLLLVEDERTLAGIIRDTLGEKGFDVSVAYDGREGLRKFNAEHPDVVVTDIMMPTMDGFTFVDHLRRGGSKTPVLFLSARSSADDVVEGFELGGNDYLRKPFAMSELIVRVRALLGKNMESKAPEDGPLAIGSYIFDPGKQTLSLGEESQQLSGRESEVLLLLANNMGSVVPMKTMLLNLWGDDGYFNARSLHVFITKLRSRFAGDTTVAIINIRGTGYKLITT